MPGSSACPIRLLHVRQPPCIHFHTTLALTLAPRPLLHLLHPVTFLAATRPRAPSESARCATSCTRQMHACAGQQATSASAQDATLHAPPCCLAASARTTGDGGGGGGARTGFQPAAQAIAHDQQLTPPSSPALRALRRAAAATRLPAPSEGWLLQALPAPAPACLPGAAAVHMLAVSAARRMASPRTALPQPLTCMRSSCTAHPAHAACPLTKAPPPGGAAPACSYSPSSPQYSPGEAAQELEGGGQL
jgi:hypothetical protein